MKYGPVISLQKQNNRCIVPFYIWKRQSQFCLQEGIALLLRCQRNTFNRLSWKGEAIKYYANLLDQLNEKNTVLSIAIDHFAAG